MYEGGARALNPPAGCTGPRVGPGSYRVGLEWRRRADGYAPFLSLTRRDLTFITQSRDDTIPGPGYYNIARTQGTVKGGKSLQNKEKRFKEISTVTPGPGSYNHAPTRDLATNSKKQQDSQEQSQMRAADILKICRKADVPSIPSPCQAFGYEEAEDGTLKKQDPPQRDLTLGPAYYRPLFTDPLIQRLAKSSVGKIAIYNANILVQNPDPLVQEAVILEDAHDFSNVFQAYEAHCPVNREHLQKGTSVWKEIMTIDANYSTLKYKGIHFGNLTGKRYEFKPREGPGPGQYDLTQEAALRNENVSVKKEEKKRSDLFIPRYHEAIELQEEKKGFPGPGQYEIESQFQKCESAVQQGRIFPHAPFLSQSKRFLPVRSITPAPGTYNEQHMALESLNRTLGMKKIPFGHTAVRFTQDFRVEKMPGPAFYNILNHSIENESIKSMYLAYIKRAAFGSSAPRCLPLCDEEEFCTPGPADYQVQKSAEKPHKPQKSLPGFLTREKRPAVAMEIPPPGYYEVQKSYQKIHGKSRYMSPRTSLARKKQGSFLSSTPRCSLFVADRDIPGPGTYNPVLSSASHVSAYISKLERFKEPKENTPGPGTYQSPVAAWTKSIFTGTRQSTMKPSEST